MDTSSITCLDIINEIEDTWGGDTMDFIASFIGYCNEETFFGVPRKVSPLDSAIVPSFGTIELRVSDVASDYYEECAYTLEQLVDDANDYSVYVTSYAYDEEYEEVYVCTDYAPSFDVTDPYELKELCRYVGVEFQASYFTA